MKYLFLGMLLCFGLSLFSQGMKPLLPNALFPCEDSYPLLKTMQANPFVFQFSSQSPQSNYFDVKDVPSFNALPSLFCKLEYKLETKSKLAPRFRLGSLGYTNWMEGKGSVYDRYYK